MKDEGETPPGNVASSAVPEGASTNNEQPIPSHCLMEEVFRPVLDRKRQRDYLAQRYRIDGYFNPDQKIDDFWHGATDLEKAIVACCISDDEVDVPGALLHEKIVDFVGIMALHCHDLHSRLLAFGVLERTQEADEDEEAFRLFRKRRRRSSDDSDYEDDSSDNDNSIKLRTKMIKLKPPPIKVEETSIDGKQDVARMPVKEESNGMGTEESEPSESTESVVVPVENMSPKNVRKKVEPPRLQQFIHVGGLKLLAQWLTEASTAKLPKLGSPQRRPSLTGTTNRPDAQPSPTGALLLPLLKLLRKIPFDVKSIKQSKINKRIKLLHKNLQMFEIDAKSKPAICGGYTVQQIQNAVNEVMRIWGEQTGLPKKTTEAELPDPFAKLKSALASRLQVLEGDDDPENVPDWLAKLRSAKEAAAKKSNKRHQRNVDMAKREREEERLKLKQQRSKDMKADLQRAQKEHQELQRKLREYNAKKQPEVQHSERTSQKSVKWKDGMTRISFSKKRDELEEVFVFDGNEKSVHRMTDYNLE